MTGAFGTPGKKPDEQERHTPKRSPDTNPFRRVVPRDRTHTSLPAQAPASNSAEKEVAQPTPATPAVPAVPQEAISPGVRLVAFGLDFIVCYVVGVLTALVPFLNKLLDLQTVMALVFLTRDFLFAGHGIGKNLMGLRVIDAASGGPPTLVQSVLRNIILIAPFVVFQIIITILKFVPVPWLDTAVLELCRLICTLYIIIVLPLEGYRTLSRPDGLRKGDELAGTQIVEAQMDFSHFLPPPKA